MTLESFKMSILNGVAESPHSDTVAGGNGVVYSLPGPCGVDYAGIGHWPGTCWRPFASTGPFNIGAGSAIVEADQKFADQLRNSGTVRPIEVGDAGATGGTGDFKKPVYYNTSASTDPQITISDDITRCGNTNGAPRLDFDNQPGEVDISQVRIAAQAKPAGGDDHHLALIYKDGATWWEYGMYCASDPPGGTWDAGETMYVGGGRRVQIVGDGLNAGATGGRFALTAGMIRAHELYDYNIDHALFIAASTTSSTTCRWPAAIDSPARDGNGQGANPIPEGTWFRLDIPDSELATYPPWKRAILKAFKNHGAYVGDTTSTGWKLGTVESGSTYASFTGWADEWDRLAQAFIADGQNGITQLGNGDYQFDLASGDWEQYIRSLGPAQQLCVDSNAPNN